jgi:hypothetical protein
LILTANESVIDIDTRPVKNDKTASPVSNHATTPTITETRVSIKVSRASILLDKIYILICFVNSKIYIGKLFDNYLSAALLA